MAGAKVAAELETRQKKWRSMKPFAKNALLKDLARRMAIIKNEKL